MADQIASRLELEPTGSHLLVGGVGSGKTTQLLIVRKNLHEKSDARVFFIDISARHDLSRLESGVLLVLAGLTIGKLIQGTPSEDVKTARRRFKEWALGWVEWVDEIDDDWEPPEDLGEDRRLPVRHKGILVPPQPPLRWLIREKGEQLKVLRQTVAEEVPTLVLLFDSLDRVSDLRAFSEVVEQDVRAIRQAGIGVVVAGPLHSMFAVGRPVADQFDYFYHIPSVDIQQDPTGQEFLFSVLRQRSAGDLLPDRPLQRIVELSGGVLRDLISLARAAGEEAYTSGSDRIEIAHVDAAADGFGRSLMLGLGPDELKALQRVLKQGTFVQTSDKDIALLVTRRVLEYRNGLTRYAVHPTIVPLLQQLSAKQ